MKMEKLTLTVDEAAKILGIGRQLAYDRVKTGEIPVIKIGRRLLVPRAALEKLLADPKPLNLTPAAK
jgi:excisionase family DNA binding protein